jgi:two-component system NtrC family sensor kinase
MLWTLSARLFLLIAVVALAGLGILAWVVLEMHTSQLQEQVVQGALRISDTVRRSTRSAMLRNRKMDVYEIIRTVGDQPGLERIRIFNKEGQITFSTEESESGHTVDKNAEACTRCHTDNEPVTRLEGRELTRVFTGVAGHRILGLITPVYNEASCVAADCHASPDQQQVLGVLDVQMSLQRMDAAVDAQNQRFLVLTYALMLVIATTCGLFLWRFVHVPVQTLIRGTEEIARGNLDYRIPIESRTEIGRLASAFNSMSAEVQRARQQLTDWARTLEQRVEEKTASLRQAQTKLVQSEKMASLGALSASVAHEINNPLSGVLTYNRLLQKMMGDSGPDPERLPRIHKYLTTMEAEVTRCGKIVSNLLEFSRQDSISVSEINLNEVVEKALFLVEHKLELQNVTLRRSLAADMPPVLCDPEQIQQALLALLINAVEAMPSGGELQVSTSVARDEGDGQRRLSVEITDTGVGIPKDVLPHLFEPFFTTKQDKKGVGLGLSVVYGIAKRHQGRIDVKSEEGRGTTFNLILPERADIRAEEAEAEQAMLRTDKRGVG